jgi:uridine kinase
MAKDVSISFDDGEIKTAPAGTSLYEILGEDLHKSPVKILAAELGGRYVSLHEPVWVNSTCRPLTMDDPEGRRSYIRSLSMLVIRAAQEVHEEKDLILDYSLGSSLFCHWDENHLATRKDLVNLEAVMRKLIAASLPITHKRVALDEARTIFLGEGQKDKAQLLQYSRLDSEDIYELDGWVDSFFGPLVPSTSLLSEFSLLFYPPGFLLVYPGPAGTEQDESKVNHSKLFETLLENERWGEILGIRNLGELDSDIVSQKIGDTIKLAETLHEQKLANIAEDIISRHARPRFVLVAGPSCSGKTTFAYRLAIHLRVMGIKAHHISLDDYYRPRDGIPRSSDGKQDFESITALDTNLLVAHLNELAGGGEVTLPHYNFASGLREEGEHLKLGADDILIIEGIHGLNPDLMPGLPRNLAYKIFVSALTQLNFDNHNRVSTTDMRTLRRVVRDAKFRDWDAVQTLSRFTAVIAGENRNIFPYQEQADIFFNSALIYELAVLAPFVEPLLAAVPPATPERAEANRLLTLLGHVLPAPLEGVPPTSILREFVGGSSFHY